MRRSWYLLSVLCAVQLAIGAEGCRRSGNASQSEAADMSLDPAQQEFLQAFLAAHDRKDLEAEKALVDWDDTTEKSRQHFLQDVLEYNLKTKIASAKIEDIPGLNPRFAATYNIPPEKFLDVVYADSRGDIRVKYPIGKKDGRFYFAMFGLTPEAMRRNNERLKQNDK